MKELHRASDAQDWAFEQRRAGRRVALVPTMGALHEGHLSLVRRARELADAVAVSIFVNPKQFGPNEDYHRYPRTMAEDLARLEAEGAEAAFLPDADEMYPEGFRTWVSVEGLSDALEGAIRPGHFRGVTTIVAKLLHVVPAHVAVFGQKDFQQLLIIRQMAHDLNIPVTIEAHPIVREADGLAMSSRNRYLDEAQRQSALSLSRALAAVRAAAADGADQQDDLEGAAWGVLDPEPGVVPDYAVVLDPDTLSPLSEGWSRAVCLVAGRLGATRLIDNCVFSRAGEELPA
ncbi:MAG TPA: pantoate--beta-alanine ligase [Armatimonadota bacterium]|jgi:pantoate--beta-alanine ligase